jgi:putative ABC transport system permease protein
MFRTAVAGLRFHAARLAASSLAIAAGVAFVAGTLILGATMTQAFFNSFAAGARNVSAAVSPPGGATQPVRGRPGAGGGPSLAPALLAGVARVPGAAAVAGRVLGQAGLIGSDGRVITTFGQPGFGINVPADRSLWEFTLALGHAPTAPGQALVDSSTAADEHLRLGQRIRVAGQNGRVLSFTLTGTMDLGASHQFRNATVTAFGTQEALSVTGQPGYDQIVVQAAPGTSQAQLAARLKALPGLARDQVQTGAELANAEATAAVRFTKQFTTLILIFALVSLLVAAIVIYNTFRILAAQRTRELALLRCVGASRRQVFGGILVEACAAGIAASVAGVIGGLGLGWALEHLFSAFGLPIPAGPLVLTPAAVSISIALGVVVTLLAATVPAWAATKVAPVAALAGHAEPRVTRAIGWRRVAVAVIFGAAGLLLTYQGIQASTKQSGFLEIAAGGMVFFVAVLALGPLIAPPVTSFFGWLPGRLAGTPARLATANARRNPHRVATTTAALTIGITLMTLFTVVASSAEASTTATIKEHYPFGYTVSSGQAGQGTVPPRIISALRAAPALGLVAPFYQRAARADGVMTPVGALGGGGLGAVSPPMTSGSLTAVRPGSAAVDATQLGTLHTRQGGTVTVVTPSAGTLRLRVAAVYNGDNSPLPSILIAVPDYLRGFRPTGAQAVYTNAAPGVGTPRARAAVYRATSGDPLLQVTTVADYSSTLASRVNQVLALFAVLLGLAILIALLGIANTLSLSVIERARETALLRALGLTRGQLRQMLLVEALLMALLGIALGVALGTGFGWAMVDAFIRSAGGGVFSVPYARIALYVALGALAGLAAAVLPARRAARSSVVAAMAET